ncbi:hypothetical protein F5878DRAFT_663928 [Lentinula raphanica]|uniref:Ubiquitin-like protease family profile domain-containing protein n=1 Tax=Lentinula raphanica TaxID=153919 RepID=A0AA38UER4_9AGAR|nr:hypothetical protein F5878DRAFT_663928 [Lentinula raphanica]
MQMTFQSSCCEQFHLTKLFKAWNLHLAKHAALLDGSLSIVDPKFPDTYLPLFAISIWKGLHKMKKEQSELSCATTWIECKSMDQAASQVDFCKACDALQLMQYRCHTRIAGAPNGANHLFLTQLLSEKPITTGMMDSMVAYLSDELQNYPDRDETFGIIKTLQFMVNLENSLEKGQGKARSLQSLETRLKAKESILLFPLFFEAQAHFLAVKIDFKQKTLGIAVGDSLVHLGMPKPKQKIRLIQEWLKAEFRQEFMEVNDSLLHRKQNDGWSCALVTANTIAVEAMDEIVWNVSRKLVDWAIWFTKLLEHLESKPSAIENASNHAFAPPIIATVAESTVEPVSELESKSAILDLTEHAISQLVTQPTLHDTSQPASQFASASDLPRVDETDIEMAIPKEMMEVVNSALAVEDRKTNIVSFMASTAADQILPEFNDTNYEIEYSDSNASTDREPDELSDEYDTDTSETHLSARKYVPRGEGRAHSSRYSQSQHHLLNSNVENDRMRDFRMRLTSITKSYKMGDVCATTKFSQHWKKCQGWAKREREAEEGEEGSREQKKLKANDDQAGRKKRVRKPRADANTHSLQSYFGNVPMVERKLKKQAAAATNTTVPCRGISSEDNPQINVYLQRTGTLGGGGSSLTKIARRMYHMDYAELLISRQQQVQLVQEAEWKWKNSHQNNSIFSVNCSKMVTVTLESKVAQDPVESSTSQCQACLSLLRLKRFKVAIRVKLPPPSNAKYIAHVHLPSSSMVAIYTKSKKIGLVFKNANHPCILFMNHVVDGKFKNRADELLKMFIGMTMQKRSHELQKKGMQGFCYAPDILKFASMLAAISPRAQFCYYIRILSPGYASLHRAKSPNFPIGITQCSFVLLKKHLDLMQWDGPVMLSCDDTKLHPSFCPYFDHDLDSLVTESWVQLENPLSFLIHPELLEKVVTENGLLKATKLRLWCIQPVALKVVPIVFTITAFCSATAQELYSDLDYVVSGFICTGIKCHNYACDGTSVKRSIEKLLNVNLTRQEVVYTIKHPGDLTDLPITLHYHGLDRSHPIAVMQDSKHGRKTA